MAYIELQPGETLTVAFADGLRVYEGPQLSIAYAADRAYVKLHIRDDEPGNAEPTLQVLDVNGDTWPT